MLRPDRRHVRLYSAGATLAGVLACAAIVWQASYSAFSSTTSNPTNNWSAGSVRLTDNDSGTALFTATDLAPGDTGTRCITVTSTGSLPSAVKLYGTGAATTNGLSTYIDLSVTQGTGGDASCTGFTALSSDAQVYTGTLAGFGSNATDYATGAGDWTPDGTGSDSRTFRFTYTLDPSTPNSAQNGTAALGFTWEAQNR